MKFIYIISIAFLSLSCKAKQNNINVRATQKVIKECPEDGVCTFDVIRDKSLLILKDEFGAQYPDIREGKKVILKFEYKRNEIPNTLDGQYIEQIFIELDHDNLDVELVDNTLRNVKLLFARFCYCKGQTGYYIVRQGKLSITKLEDKNYQLNLTFKIDEVPQIITEIDEVFSLK